MGSGRSRYRGCGRVVGYRKIGRMEDWEVGRLDNCQPSSLSIFFLVLTFSVVGPKTGKGGRDQEVVEPVVKIDPAIKFVSWRIVGLTDPGLGQ